MDSLDTSKLRKVGQVQYIIWDQDDLQTMEDSCGDSSWGTLQLAEEAVGDIKVEQTDINPGITLTLSILKVEVVKTEEIPIPLQEIEDEDDDDFPTALGL